MSRVGITLGMLAGCAGVLAAQAAPPALALPWIMRGTELVGREPGNVRWSPDGQWLYFNWLAPGASWREPARLYRVRAAPGSVPERLSVVAADSAASLLTDGSVSPDLRRRVVSVGGDLFLIELPAGTIRRLTETPAAAEVEPSFDLAGNRVFFRRDLNLFAFSLTDWGVKQLTNIRPGPAADTAALKGQRGFVATEEKNLLVAVRDRLWRDSVMQADKRLREAGQPAPLYLAKGEQIVRIVPSPAATHALIFTSAAGEPRRAQVPNYVTTSGYTEEIDTRTKVGDAQGLDRVGLLTFGTGAVKWIHPIEGDTSGSYASLGDLGWNDTGTSALVTAVRRDYTARHLIRVDADSAGTVRTLDVLRDSAWVGGPCGECGGWLPGREGLWFVSEADGFAHLYTMASDGTDRRQRTRGRWEVVQAALTPDRTHWLLHTSEVSPFERHAYLMPVGAGPLQRLTTEVGGHTVVPSPDGKWQADVFSESNRPPELFLRGPRATPVALTRSPSAEWLAFPWLKPAIVDIPASDGIKVPARIYRPEQMGARPNGAAVIFVHGAGYLHNVHNYWSSYFREYMFNHLLAQRGFVVLDIDYRASAGYGRDWRTAIYRHMGGRDLADQVDGARYLHDTFGVSFDRIGIYGGSYGGFMTLMALFTAPKFFGAGAALRSVTDWAHYNHPYTAGILNEPQEDSTAFRQSSPIYFAEGLEDPLLMAHGMVDTNVHFQDIIRLTQRLIELGKTNWELAVYPVEDHGFIRPDSWTDEYRRILELFERALVPK